MPPTTDFQYDVFLSYSSKDRPIVLPLAQRLQKDGLRVWFDESQIRPGDSIPAKIEEGLENSRILIFCMSANAFGSDWTQLESQTFRFRDPLNKDRRFIPLRLDDAPIKGSLTQFLYINWGPEIRDQEYAKLIETCRSPRVRPTTEQQTAREQFIKNVISLGHTDSVWIVAFSPGGHIDDKIHNNHNFLGSWTVGVTIHGNRFCHPVRNSMVKSSCACNAMPAATKLSDIQTKSWTEKTCKHLNSNDNDIRDICSDGEPIINRVSPLRFPPPLKQSSGRLVKIDIRFPDSCMVSMPKIWIESGLYETCLKSKTQSIAVEKETTIGY